MFRWRCDDASLCQLYKCGKKLASVQNISSSRDVSDIKRRLGMSTVKRFLLIGIAAVWFPHLWGQEATWTWEGLMEQTMEADGEEDALDEERYELLEELHAHPMNLNEATVEDLLQLPFLNEEQARDIVFYCTMHGPMQSTGELMFIESIGRRERMYLQLFCYAGEVPQKQGTTARQLLKHIRNEFALRTDVPFYYKAGQQNYPEEILRKYPNRQYRGDPLHIMGRYSLSSMNHLYAGVQMEKDAGERGVDYLSGYILLKDIKIGKSSSIREAIVGNYRADFGLGLAINTHVSFGKSMMVSNLGHIDRGFSKHSSTLETGYLTGAAIRFQYRHITMSAFGSYNPTDGTLLEDSSGISALKTDGLHRTPLEHSKRHNINIINAGGNIHWNIKNLQLSATAVITHYSTPLAPKWDTPSTLYKRYNAQGQNFQTYSIAYAWHWRKWQLAGEGAISHAQGLPSGMGHEQGLATLQTLQYKLNSQNTLTMAARYYGAKFVSLNGKAFGENSRPQNEAGVFLAWRSTMLPSLCIDTYVDLMHFPWMKYGVSNRSNGIDGMMQVAFTPNGKSSWMLRYRVKSKEKDYDESDGSVLLYNVRHTLKLQHSYNVGKSWTFRTTLNGCLIKFGPDKPEKGFSVSENVRWAGKSGKLKIDVGLCYFNTDTYNARVFAYEPSLLYSFGLMSYYYKGIRGIAMVNWQICKGLSLTGKLSTTRYFNQDTIGTGTEMIATSHKEDLQLMARWRF